MSSIDKFKSQRNVEMTRKYKERLVDGGKICLVCERVRKLEEYNHKQSYCKKCSSDKGKARRKKQKFKLW